LSSFHIDQTSTPHEYVGHLEIARFLRLHIYGVQTLGFRAKIKTRPPKLAMTLNQNTESARRWQVALLEDNVETRVFFEAGIRASPHLELVGSFGSIAQARAWFADHQAEVFLTDIGLPDGNATDLIRQLALAQPACEILVVSMFGDDMTVLNCIEAGALGYIQKDSALGDIAETILDLKRGASPISPMIARKLLARLKSRPQSEPSSDSARDSLAKLQGKSPIIPSTAHQGHAPQDLELLTAREAEVLDLIARGYAYAEIARLTELSVHTVQFHIKNLYTKLAVHSRSEAVFEAARMGLLKSP
jgi:DNA-binding NarL/FixJ family response regulator